MAKTIPGATGWSACLAFALIAGCGRAASESGVRISLVDVTEEAGLSLFWHDNGARGAKYYAEQMGSGGGFLDYDGDGWQDILLLGGGSWESVDEPGYRSLWLFRNLGDGTFADRTDEAGLRGYRAFTLGMAAADIDNDGDADLLITNLNENALFVNEGGRFSQAGSEAGLDGLDEWSSSAMFFEANQDGLLDVFVGNYAEWTPETDKFCPEGGNVKLYCVPADYGGKASRFYLNRGGRSFEEKTVEAGLVAPLGKALGIVEWDFNRDGLSDFSVANDGEGDLLYINRGDGSFEERGVLTGMAFSEHGEARAGMGIDVGVVDASGNPSLFVGNFSEEMIGVYRQTADGFFLDRAGASRIGLPSLNTLTFGLFLLDVELDGDLDLFAANGHVYPDRLKDQDKITFRQRAQLFLNIGGGEFQEVPRETTPPLSLELVARGAAYADYDLDGDLDILITENDGPAHLWRNESGPGNYLRVELEGTAGNRDAIGAEIRIRAAGRTQVRRRRTGSSYLSQSELAVVFGLGSAAVVDSLQVRWPGGGVEDFVSIPSNRAVRIVEGSGQLEAVAMAGAAALDKPQGD